MEQYICVTYEVFPIKSIDTVIYFRKHFNNIYRQNWPLVPWKARKLLDPNTLYHDTLGFRYFGKEWLIKPWLI